MNRTSSTAVPAAMQLRPMSTRSKIWLLVLAALIPLFIISLAGGMILSTVAPAQQDVGAALSLALAAVLVIGMSVLTLQMAKRHRISLGADSIEVVTTFYRRQLTLAEMDLAGARVIDLDEHTAFKPMLKTNAMYVPGFRSGWFRLRNWQRALVALSDGPRVLLIPTGKGYNLLLQPEQPQALLDRLRSMAAERNLH